MNNNLLHGQLVRLAAANSETDAESMARWSRNAEYLRMLDSEPAAPKSVKQVKGNIAEWMEHERPDSFGFMIRVLDGDRLIGFVGLGGINWNNGDGFVGIGIGEADDWGKSLGTDAMRVLLCFAFDELNLHRVSLSAYAYNPRAIRAYEKAGFKIEGRARQVVNRDGQRDDEIFMGVLREDWERAKGTRGRSAG
jgi:RimJ/RimL family protein N-acetyltransferase